MKRRVCPNCGRETSTVDVRCVQCNSYLDSASEIRKSEKVVWRFSSNLTMLIIFIALLGLGFYLKCEYTEWAQKQEQIRQEELHKQETLREAELQKQEIEKQRQETLREAQKLKQETELLAKKEDRRDVLAMQIDAIGQNLDNLKQTKIYAEREIKKWESKAKSDSAAVSYANTKLISANRDFIAAKARVGNISPVVGGRNVPSAFFQKAIEERDRASQHL
jgi:ssDNA-binding Zn-finger/Zn-ribbon topoisomerase 1